MQIFANPNSGHKLSTDYQSANDSDAKIISIKCSVNVKCNLSICVKNNNETEESKYEGTWNLGTEDFTIAFRFDYDVEDVTISNYYTFTYTIADEITGNSFEEKFILLETPRRLKETGFI